MLPLKRILCPTDLSADSRAALKVAGEMALYFSAELTVLYVQAPTQPVVWPYEGLGINPYESGLSTPEAMVRREKELVAETSEIFPPALNLKLRVVAGEPATAILKMARQKKTDLIVIAPHGHNRLRKAIFGSTAEEVVKNSPCPVVTMHAGQETDVLAQEALAQEAEI
jgi:nucleotide-binding universal stress UspA family protein